MLAQRAGSESINGRGEWIAQRAVRRRPRHAGYMESFVQLGDGLAIVEEVGRFRRGERRGEDGRIRIDVEWREVSPWAVENGPLSATQFHPEKSGAAGIRLLSNWIGTLRAD